MVQPTGSDVYEFAQSKIWDVATTDTVPQSMQARVAFKEYLVKRGVNQFVADEFVETNLSFLIGEIQKTSEDWSALGVPSPIYITDQYGRIVTWSNPRFEEITGKQKIGDSFCGTWSLVRNSYERDFLFFCVAYLACLGCRKIFVTDTSGDCGIDVIGSSESGALRGLVLLIQAKTSQNNLSKDALFKDYTKYLLLRHEDRWNSYLDALELAQSKDGIGVVYMFVSNVEFNDGLRKAARTLPVILRSGRQIAHTLSSYASTSKLIRFRDRMGSLKADLTVNLAKGFQDS